MEKGFPAGFYPISTQEEEGIGQSSYHLCFKGGERYIVRVWAKSLEEIRLTCEIKSSCFIPCHSATFSLAPSEDFTLLEYTFVLSDSLERGRFEVWYPKDKKVFFSSFSIKEADHFYGMRRDAVELLKETGPLFSGILEAAMRNISIGRILCCRWMSVPV